MLLSRDGTTAVVADPDRDFISFVDLSTYAVRRADLSPHDEPGRMAEDHAGLVYAALRGSGDLATLSIANGQLLERRAACTQPRGVAYDAVRDEVIVACATGEVVTLPAVSGAATQASFVEPDLRDVVVDGDFLVVSKFRAADILRLDRSRKVVGRTLLPSPQGHSPAVAWRMREAQGGDLSISYQIESTSFIATTPGGYGGAGPVFPTSAGPRSSAGGGPSAAGRNFGGGVIASAMVTVSRDLSTTQDPRPVGPLVLPVDFALPPQGSADGSPIFIGAGNWKSSAMRYGRVTSSGPRSGPAPLEGQLIAVEVAPDGTVYLQSREPARLHVMRTVGGVDQVVASVVLSDLSREDTGHTVFHTDSASGLACASCHGEGADDAQTWNFDGVKPRRTPSLLGTVKGTAPYHWDADFVDLPALVHEVYIKRMGGRVLAHDQVSALTSWVEALPAPRRPPVDPDAKNRGQTLFSGKADCARCHSGPAYTNNTTVDVGTGAAFQVPPLVGVGARGPFLHSGCASTLTERFTGCATAAHGQTSSLSSDEIADLVAFLNSL
jgi:hypothetical protein